MPRTLSSNLAFFWKFIFPGSCIPGLGLITFLAFTESRRDQVVLPRILAVRLFPPLQSEGLFLLGPISLSMSIMCCQGLAVV